MKRNYELMFIINPQVTAEERVTVLESVKKIMEIVKAEDLIVDEWGERKLAYPIQKKTTGYYVLLKFIAEGEALAEIERRINIVEPVMRYIVVNKDA